MKLSVVIPAYNNADYIERTVDSVLAQVGVEFEVIVADHDSSDGTAAVLERYAADPRVTLLRTERGGGAARNWNRVTEAASGEYLRLVCGDDLLRPGTLAAHVAALDAADGAVMASSPRDVVDAQDGVLIAGRGLDGLRGRVAGAEALRATVRAGTNVFGEPACVTLRREALVSAGGWDARYAYFIDAASYARVLVGGDLVVVPQTGAAFRISDSQWSVRLAGEQAAQARAFHRDMRALAPEAISAGDVLLGDVKARVLAVARRAAYLVLRRRMRAAAR